MMKEIEMKDLCLMHYLLCIEVHQQHDEIFVCQTKYAKFMLKFFSMDNCKCVETQIAHGVLLTKDDGINKVDITHHLWSIIR